MSSSESSRIAYTRPSVTPREVELVTDAARNGWGDKCYEYIGKFERVFAKHVGAPYAVSTSSCTGALTLGLATLGVGEGDEVILADTNWIASVAPVVHMGARPVFVDILPDSWCLDPALVEKAITPRTKAILAVHLYGNLCDMNALLDIGARHGLPVIEDAAEALGSSIAGQPAGSMGIFGTFSFHGTKTLTTGEGGMFVTSDKNLYERVLTLSNHGRSRAQRRQFWPDMVGYKFKMSNLQAAFGVGQMERIDELTARKREILAYYRKRLSAYEGLTLNPEPIGTVNGAWMPTVVFDPRLNIGRDKLLEAFGRANIDARVFFWPLSSLDMFEGCPHNVHAYDIPGRAINLPSYHDISEVELARVIAVIEDLLQNALHPSHALL